jgi:hypothetical protein
MHPARGSNRCGGDCQHAEPLPAGEEQDEKGPASTKNIQKILMISKSYVNFTMLPV